LEIIKNSEITLKMKVGETFLVKKIINNWKKMKAKMEITHGLISTSLDN
jgi:hypothetical protein